MASSGGHRRGLPAAGQHEHVVSPVLVLRFEEGQVDFERYLIDEPEVRGVLLKAGQLPFVFGDAALADYRAAYPMPLGQPCDHPEEQVVVLPRLIFPHGQDADGTVGKPRPFVRRGLGLHHERHVVPVAGSRVSVRRTEHGGDPMGSLHPEHRGGRELPPSLHPAAQGVVPGNLGIQDQTVTEHRGHEGRQPSVGGKGIADDHHRGPPSPQFLPQGARRRQPRRRPLSIVPLSPESLRNSFLGRREPQHRRVQRLVFLALPAREREEGDLVPRVEEGLHREVLVGVEPGGRVQEMHVSEGARR